MYDAQATRDYYDEKAWNNERRLPRELFKQSYGMGRLALSSALFRVARGNRQTLKVTLPAWGGGSISYTGMELRQDDCSALLGLIHSTRKKLVDDAVDFNPYEFCRRIGWEDDSRSVKKLRECLVRMMGGVLSIRTADGASATHVQLVGRFNEYNSSAWCVNLHKNIVDLFVGGMTFMPIEARMRLADGMQTWLSGFLEAHREEDSFELADLHRFSGSASTVKEFGSTLRNGTTMDKLIRAGVIKGCEFTYGKLRVAR